MSASRTFKDCVLQVRNLSKSFPGVQALADIWLDVEPGKVHALLGENGAGKSTLMKTLIGLELPDAGEILFKGRRVQFKNPHAARQCGLSMIHQELLIFPELTVAENIFLGQEPASRFPGWLDRWALNREAQRVLDRLGVALPPTKKMKELSVAEMQMVEIAKALAAHAEYVSGAIEIDGEHTPPACGFRWLAETVLSSGKVSGAPPDTARGPRALPALNRYHAEVLIMDEPTSAISEREVQALFAVIRDLKSRGVAVIYISHKLDEVFRIADTVTVLRDGRYVATHDIAELDREKLISLMVGRELDAAVAHTVAQKSAVVLAVRGLTKAGRFHEVSFELRRGEILGVAGLMGAGRTDVANALYGLAPADAGEIRVHGRTVRMAKPSHAIANGIALVSEDRKEFGLVLKMSVKHNLTLSNLRRCCRGPWINSRAENRVADERIKAFAIKTPNRQQTVNYLSGGNQQKVVLAKALLTEPDILILDEPTRGIDIGAKVEIYAIITKLAREGKAVLLISSELPELLSLSDRLLVMRTGTIVAELDPQRTTQEEVLKYAMPN